MDEINDFFDFSKKFERKIVPRGCISGTVATTVMPNEDSKLMKREYVGTEYSLNLVEAERLKLEQVGEIYAHQKLQILFYHYFSWTLVATTINPVMGPLLVLLLPRVWTI